MIFHFFDFQKTLPATLEEKADKTKGLTLPSAHTTNITKIRNQKEKYKLESQSQSISLTLF